MYLRLAVSLGDVIMVVTNLFYYGSICLIIVLFQGFWEQISNHLYAVKVMNSKEKLSISVAGNSS